MANPTGRGCHVLVAGHIVSTFGTSIYVIALVPYLAELTNSAAVLRSISTVRLH